MDEKAVNNKISEYNINYSILSIRCSVKLKLFITVSIISSIYIISPKIEIREIFEFRTLFECDINIRDEIKTAINNYNLTG